MLLTLERNTVLLALKINEINEHLRGGAQLLRKEVRPETVLASCNIHFD
jgi:hypothetical protein